MKYITGSLVLVWLTGAILAASAQSPAVLDTSGQPLQRGAEYIIRPAVTDIGGPLTLITRTGSPCPPYVGQRNVTADAIAVTFAPFDEGESVVRESENFKVAFSAATTCVISTAWKVDFDGAPAGRRLIATGEDDSRFGLANYFEIRRGAGGTYNVVWCPAELCPICRLECGSVGSLVENGQLFAALHGNALPLEFVKASQA